MNRRAFLSFLSVAPVAVPMLASATPVEYARLSVEKDDPGYEAYGRLIGDGRWPTVYLDGVKADGVMTADTREGWIKRFVITENGNIAHNHQEVLTEIVRGKVTIEIPAYEPRVIGDNAQHALVSPESETKIPTAEAVDLCHSAQDTETLIPKLDRRLHRSWGVDEGRVRG